MGDKLSKTQMLELEKQFSCPSGDFGIQIGETMHQLNYGMTMQSIQFLNLENKHAVLELGHGNCRHLKDLLDCAEEI